jgi:hypothetical protein
VTLLDFPTAVLLVYPWETVIAEKLHAIVELGMDNSRMKDYLDLDHLARTRPFPGPTLAEAIRATFARRGTPLPGGVPAGLGPAFAEDASKQEQWRAFVRRISPQPTAPALSAVVASLGAFLLPPLNALSLQRPFDASWPPGGPWSSH